MTKTRLKTLDGAYRHAIAFTVGVRVKNKFSQRVKLTSLRNRPMNGVGKCIRPAKHATVHFRRDGNRYS